MISSREEAQLRNKITAFETETRTKKAVHLTMVTTYGIVKNSHADHVQSEVILEDLFK